MKLNKNQGATREGLKPPREEGGTCPAGGSFQGEDYIAVGLGGSENIQLSGRVGDYFGALNNGAKICLEGEAGRFVADTASAGEIIVLGGVGDGLGFSLYGGIVVVNGKAGHNVGHMNKGGTIIIDGDVGDRTGLYSLGGDIVITGDAGKYTGEWLIRGTIYVGGAIASLGHNARIEELDTRDHLKLEEWSTRYGLNISPDNFRKIVPDKLRPFYQGKEVN